MQPASLLVRIHASRADQAIVLPPRPAARDAAEARRQDVADLRLLPLYDRSFSVDSLQRWRSGIGDLDRDAAALSEAAFIMGVSRLVALAGNGHTTVDRAGRLRPFGRAPLRFGWFSGELYVVRASGAAEPLLGRRVVTIDGRPIATVLADLAPYISGTVERARDDSPPLMECPALLQAVWPDTDGRHLMVGVDDGTALRLDARPPAPDPFAAQPILAIGPGARAGWKTVLDAAPQLPLSLREPDRVAFSAPLAAGGLYLRINANADDARGPLAAQLAAIAAARPPGGWRWIALDLRFNDGGDELKTMAFTKSLPDLLAPDGALWILTGNATFSAGIITAARAKYLVGGRAHIVGEIAGDRNPFWTVGGPPLVLRNSGISIGHAYFKQDWARGCHAIDLCNPLQFLYGVAAGDLSPEIAVGWSFADYAAGRDTAMEIVEALGRRLRT